EAAEVRVDLDTPDIALAASDGLHRLIDRVAATTDPSALEPTALDTVARAAEVAARMKSAVDLWFAQNATIRLLDRLPELRRRARCKHATSSASHVRCGSRFRRSTLHGMSFADLAVDTAVRADPDVAGRYRIALPDHWDYLLPSGGVVMTCALRAAEFELADP